MSSFLIEMIIYILTVLLLRWIGDPEGNFEMMVTFALAWLMTDAAMMRHFD